MKLIRYSKSKDRKLNKLRKISFEDIIDAIQNNKILAVEASPNTKTFPDQKAFIIALKNYVYVVPFVENEKEIFLKTIYPSRKFKKKYEKSL